MAAPGGGAAQPVSAGQRTRGRPHAPRAARRELRALDSRFTPSHRGGSGPPLVLLHGFTDTWRTWELVLPILERRHDVLAPTLMGHAGGPPLVDDAGVEEVADAVERAMDEAGFETAHVVGNSLGGYLALHMAARGRARTVVGFAPGGGWTAGDESYKETLAFFPDLQPTLQRIAPHAEALVATPEGRRRSTAFIVENGDHIPDELLAHLIRAAASCEGTVPLTERARRVGWSLEPEKITCPVRIVWGTKDKLLPWPSATVRYREEWVPQADWVELEGVGHCPQLDVPLVAAELILGFTAP